MRMWMLPPEGLCRKHLLGEHNELHMLAGSLQRGKRLDGFIRRGLLEPAAMQERHDALVQEMQRRGYAHNSPLPDCAAALAAYAPEIRTAKVRPEVAAQALAERCEACAQGLRQALLVPW